MAERFQHTPLNRDSKEIRLVKILYENQTPGDPKHESILPGDHILGDQIVQPRCIIKHVDLGSKPQYKALSYNWGPPGITFDISIDGKLHNIRQNLWGFLRQKSKDREFCETTWLWIDQICIKQDDLKERTHQVAQMAELYSGAEKMLIWLGPGTEETNRAMDCILEGSWQSTELLGGDYEECHPY